MPRYYFDLYNDIDAIDENGVVLAGLEAAQTHALREAREMICASVEEQGKIDLRHRIAIRDEAGNGVGEIRFENAVQFLRDGSPV